MNLNLSEILLIALLVFQLKIDWNFKRPNGTSLKLKVGLGARDLRKSDLLNRIPPEK